MKIKQKPLNFEINNTVYIIYLTLANFTNTLNGITQIFNNRSKTSKNADTHMKYLKSKYLI